MGSRYTATLEATRGVPFTCRSCAFRGVAVVRAKGVGEASAPLWIGTGAAKDRARTDAEKDLRRKAEILAAAGTCPKCSKAWRDDLHAERSSAQVFAVLIAMGGTALLAFTVRRFDPMLGFLISAAIAGLHYSSKSWLWSEVDRRVSVVTEADARKLLDTEARAALEASAAAAEAESRPLPPPATNCVLCPLWKSGYQDVVSKPLHGKLRLGLLAIEGDEGTWIEASDLTMEPEVALEIARRGLAARSSKPLREVQPGVWKAEWDDWFAAARIAVPELFASLKVDGAPIAFTPSENTLFIAGENDRAGLELATKLACTHAREVITGKTVAGAFTARPWKLDGEHFAPWYPSADSEPLLKQLEEVVGDKGFRP